MDHRTAGCGGNCGRSVRADALAGKCKVIWMLQKFHVDAPAAKTVYPHWV